MCSNLAKQECSQQGPVQSLISPTRLKMAELLGLVEASGANFDYTLNL